MIMTDKKLNRPEKLKHNRHIGEMVRKTIEERNMSVSDFAKAIHCSRTNVYNIFKREQIDISRLWQIVSVLGLSISDFIVENDKASDRYIAIIDIKADDLLQMSEDYDFTYLKYWKVK